MNWCFLGGTQQGLTLLTAAVEVIGLPVFVSAPSGIGEADTERLSVFCENRSLPLIDSDAAFDRLRTDPSIKGLVCRYPIIPDGLLKSGRFLNLHNSLLPRWRGVHPLQWALLAGDAEAGITFHLCEKRVDSGSISLQKSFCIDDDDDINDLFERVILLTQQSARLAIENWLSGNLKSQPPEKLAYASRLDGSTQALSSDLSMEMVHRIVRVSQPPWPRAYFTDELGEIEVLRCVRNDDGRRATDGFFLDGFSVFFASDKEAQRIAALMDL